LFGKTIGGVPDDPLEALTCSGFRDVIFGFSGFRRLFAPDRGFI
jgi:hypothetical protein